MEKKWLEFSVGVFLIVGFLCLAYLSFSLGHLGFGRSSYEVRAVFHNVSGLKSNAAVTMAGVNIGDVRQVLLQNGQAVVVMSIQNEVQIEEDSVASIKTMGIIGDKYVAISPGAMEKYIEPGGEIRETRAPLDLESLISKFVFGSLDSKPKAAD